jgi:hypothetical protein
MLFATRLLFDDVGRIACRRQAGSVSHRSMLARLAKVFVPQGVVPGACFVLRRHCPLGLLRCWASPLASCLLLLVPCQPCMFRMLAQAIFLIHKQPGSWLATKA